MYFIFSTRLLLKLGSSSGRALSLVLLPCLRLTPRRHRKADGKLSPLYPPLPSFSSFGAACLCEALRSSCLAGQKHPSAASSSLKCRKHKVHFTMNVNIKSSITFADTVDAFTAAFAVWTRPSLKGRSSATHHS